MIFFDRIWGLVFLTGLGLGGAGLGLGFEMLLRVRVGGAFIQGDYRETSTLNPKP